MHKSSPLMSKFRSKEYKLIFLVGVFVFACFFFYSHDGAKLRPTEVLQHEPLDLPPEVDPSITKQSPAPLDDGLNAGLASGKFASAPTTDLSSTVSHLTTTTHPPPLTSSTLRAIIVESVVIPNLIPIMLHFATVLGPSWGLILFTLEDGWTAPLSPAWQRAVAAGTIEVRFLPAGTALTSSRDVSMFLTAPWLWEQVETARAVLLFQTDSVLCSRSEAAVDDYLEWDLVGAPIGAAWGAGYNGGLSLRNPRLFLNVTREVDFVASGGEYEDQWFYKQLVDRGARMPEVDVAKTFAVETIYYETPLGFHQPQRWQPEKMAEIEEWCPEVKMLIGRRAT